MLRKNIRPDPVSCSFVTKACVNGSLMLGGLQIHGRILRDGHQLDSLLMTGLMDFYSCFRVVGDAFKVFDEIARRDTVVWNVLISCCTGNGRTRDALDVFDRMESLKCEEKPDDVTCLLVLQACAKLGELEFGERVHKYIRENGYDKIKNICNTLIAMYSKCGDMDKAYEVFKGMNNKSVVSWSAMISGLASNGFGREAIEAFWEMHKMGITPDEQIFTGVLSACSRSGLLDEGRMFFNSMSNEFGIMPDIHHYGCVVDLLSRAGLLEEAYNLILSMRMKPDAVMWRTLLGACKVHSQFELGERIVGQLVKLKAQKAGDYLLLLNIYSSAGDEEKVLEVRKLLKENSIKTTPASCTIELKGDIHSFVADDTSHPKKEEIYEMLEEIEKQLKIAGYVTEVTTELHKTDAAAPAGNQFRFSCHSEKLAIAFGVLMTPPGTKIRVAKNLRTCADCHKFAEIFSGVYNREVVITDRTHFHHFREGRCSCNRN
ncbi:Pentatricopeptide repeat-containing protein [Heracleum sosnowskyi]|uniref:Pentatricopeptide repeat-containing protein n=1 Tax=Heracleum sosnowskyi TaxID=360622 RepID=A0AAD8H932_9APIA|nr:Pentatricopeptide repeat-containing protein [Heracleum sosnowskyi]